MTSHVGRGNRDDKFTLRSNLALFGELRFEIVSALPPLIAFGFDFLRLVGVHSDLFLDLVLFRDPGFGDGGLRSSHFGLLFLKFRELFSFLALFLDCM